MTSQFQCSTTESGLFGQEFHEIQEQRGDGNQTGTAETGESEWEEVETVEAHIEIDTPVASAPPSQDLPAVEIEKGPPPSVLQDSVPSAILHDVGSSFETFVNIPSTTTSSPTMSISAISNLSPAEFGEGIEHGEGDSTTTPSRHHTFHFEDGKVEIVCGNTIFRVHSTIISFSSPKLRDILSPSTLLGAPMPKGCPRIGFTDSAGDFAVLLEMIYTPGYDPPPPSAVRELRH